MRVCGLAILGFKLDTKSKNVQNEKLKQKNLYNLNPVSDLITAPTRLDCWKNSSLLDGVLFSFWE